MGHPTPIRSSRRLVVGRGRLRHRLTDPQQSRQAQNNVWKLPIHLIYITLYRMLHCFALLHRERLHGVELVRVGGQQPAQLHGAPQLVQRLRRLLPRPHRSHGRNQHVRRPQEPLTGKKTT